MGRNVVTLWLLHVVFFVFFSSIYSRQNETSADGLIGKGGDSDSAPNASI